MVGFAMTPAGEESGLDELLQPEPLPDGTEPEQRIVYCPISWERYLGFALSRSRLLPGLDTSLLEGCAAIRSWQQARQAFRAGLTKD